MATLNVTDYGAVADGETDDSPAIQAAIDDAGAGDTVYLPGDYNEGHYRVLADGGGAVVLDGASMADDLTVEGDLGGEPHASGNTLVELGDVPDDQFQQVFRVLASDTLDFTLREMEISGNNTANETTTDYRPGAGISEFDEGATTGHSHVYERLYVFECAGGGIMCRVASTIRRCAAIDNDTHGITPRGPGSGAELLDSRVENNGTPGVWGTGFDLGVGDHTVDGVFAKNNLAGNKFNSRTGDVELRNVTVEGGDLQANTLLRYADGATTTASSVTVDTVAVRDADEIGLRVDGESVDTWTVTSLEVTNTAQSGETDKGVFGRGDMTVDADEVTVLDNGGWGIGWAADGEMAIGVLHADGNDDGATGGFKSDNLTVDSQDSDRVTLDTPTRDDVGVWTSDSGSEPTEEETGSLSSESGALQAGGGALSTATGN